MRNLFSQDSKFMIALNTIADYILFNLIFLFTCIPVITIGAAKTALYRVMFDMVDERGNPYKRYFKTFVREFKTVTPLCLLKDGVIALLFWEFMVVLQVPQMPLQKVVLFILGAVGFLWMIVFSTLFAQVALFDSTRKQYLHNCLYITLSRFLRCLLTALMDILPLVLFLLDLNLFFLVLPIWGFLYFSVTTNLSVRLWTKPFEKYIEEMDN